MWGQVLALALLLFAGIGLQLINPQILGRFIDVAATQRGSAALTRFALLFLTLAFLLQLISLAETYLATNVSLTATNRLRADLARHCLQLDMAFHNQHTPGELIERVDGDVGILGNFFSRFAIDLLGNAVLMLGILVVLFRIDWRLGLALGGFALLTLVTINILRDAAVPHFRAARQATAELFGFLEERLTASEDVRSNGAAPYVLRRFYQRAREQLRRQIKANLVAVSAFSASRILFTLGTIVALGLGAYLYRSGAVTIGIVYLIYRYTTLLTQPIQQINHQVQDLQQAGAALLRIRDLLAVESHVRDTGRVALPTGALAVEFESVSFRYVAPAADQNAQPPWGLEGISFSLAPGSVLGLLGHTGSGKSSLIRLLFRLYEPTAGSIRLGGVDLRDVRLAELRRRVGMVTQEVQLFHASLRDNLTLFDAGIPDDRILAVLEQIGLGDWYRTLPDGLATTLSSRSSGLSAGEAQLLAVARVFLKDPDVVILDEASSRLDPATEALLERAIDSLLKDRTAIVIAHRLTTVRRADHIMILDNGRCVEFGHYERLTRDPHSRFSSLLRTALEQVPPKT